MGYHRVPTALKFALVMGFLITAFQNCGQSFESDAEVQEALSRETEERDPSIVDPILPGTTGFKAGDTFDAKLLPYTPKGRLIDDLKKYTALTTLKAIAVAPSGVGIAVGNSKFESQDEANQIVLEWCQLLAHNEPCGLLAEGNKFKFDEAAFLTQQISMIDSGMRDVDVARIPGFLKYWEPLFKDQWENSTESFNSIAIGLYGKVVRGWGKSQVESNRRALEMCEALDDNHCTLYAEGNTVHFNVSVFNFNTTVKYVKFAPASLAPSSIPFISDADRVAQHITNLRKLANDGEKPVLAISRYGHLWVHYDKNSTLEQNATKALAKCNEQLHKGGNAQLGCVVYSQNDQVVLTRAAMTAAKF